MQKIKIPYSEFNFTFSRSSGPGGQNINKVNSKVTLNWNIKESESCPEEVKSRFKQSYPHLLTKNEEIIISSQKYRSQQANIDDCIQKIHSLINSVAVPPKPRKATKPKRSAILKRLASKKKEGEKKKLRRSLRD